MKRCQWKPRHLAICIRYDYCLGPLHTCTLCLLWAARVFILDELIPNHQRCSLTQDRKNSCACNTVSPNLQDFPLRSKSTSRSASSKDIKHHPGPPTGSPDAQTYQFNGWVFFTLPGKTLQPVTWPDRHNS